MILIDVDVLAKIRYWIQLADGEVSGLGKIVYEDGIFHVVDAMLLHQTASSASTDINANAVTKAMYETRDSEGELRWWWHSHVNMDCFWSEQDIQTILDLSKYGWFAATVFNKNEESLSCINQNVPISIFQNDVELKINYCLDEDKLEQEFNDKVHSKDIIRSFTWSDIT